MAFYGSYNNIQFIKSATQLLIKPEYLLEILTIFQQLEEKV